MSIKKCIIIFSGFNQRAVIAFIRTLELHHIEYAIIAKSDGDTIFNTAYKNRVVTVRHYSSLDLGDIIQALINVKGKITAHEYIIAPSTEALNRFLLKNRNAIESNNIVIPLISKVLYENISDKYSFGKLCIENGIRVPFEHPNLKKIQPPFVAKPKQYFAEDGSTYTPYLILNEQHKQDFYHKFNPTDFFYQEFIHGKSFYLLYYFHRNGRIFKFSQENIIQQPNGKSIVAAVSSNFHNSGESLKYEQLFKTLNFFGFVMIEIKQHEDLNYMIEANPRFWGPSQLFVDAGMNFFEVFLHDFDLIATIPQFARPIDNYKYFWFGGVMEVLKQNKELIYHQGNSIELMEGLHFWLQSDVYKRKDTLDIFKNEII